jgi:hypothetical protein
VLGGRPPRRCPGGTPLGPPAPAGVFGAKVTGMADGTDLETTARDTGCGQGPRKRRLAAPGGRGHAIEVTVYGWKGRLVSEAMTTLPWAGKVGQIQAHEPRWTRALLTQARRHLAGDARRPKVIGAKGWLAGTTLWGRDQPGSRLVGPAQTNMAVAADARAQAAAGAGIPVGRRVHTVRHGHGKTAGTARLESEVGGITGLTPSDQYGPGACAAGQPPRLPSPSEPCGRGAPGAWAG